MVDLARRKPSEIIDDDFTRRVLGCGIKVHKFTGVGLIENAYETFFAHELVKNGFSVVRQMTLPAVYDGVAVDLGYVPDINDERGEAPGFIAAVPPLFCFLIVLSNASVPQW